MRSDRAETGTVGADLTARARIRDAAIGAFGREGFGASVRTIAADAGVSPALVIHHFGSKEALRAHCDEHVLGVYRDEKSRALGEQTPAQAIAALATIEQYAPMFSYLVRGLLGGGATGARFVEGLVGDTAAYLEAGVAGGTVRPSRDPDGRARLVTATTVGLLVMAQLDAERGDGPDLATDPGGALHRMTDRALLAGLELYTHGLFADDAYLRAFLDAGHRPGPAPEGGDDD